MLSAPRNILQPADTENMIKQIKNNQLKFYQFYNFDFDTKEFPFIDFMMRKKGSETAKLLNKTYYDIETYVPESGEFTDPHEHKYPINAIALYNNITNISYIIAYVTDCDIQDPDIIEKGINDIYNEKCEENPIYIVDGMKIELFIVPDEKALLKKHFELVREISTLCLIGYNSQNFDDIYTILRLEELFGTQEAHNIISEFGTIKNRNDMFFEIPDYQLFDLLFNYKPVPEGGGGLGSSLPNYMLSTVATKELGITKLELEGGFRHNYLHNIILYLAYNMFDVILTFKIDDKLGFLESMYELAKYNDSTMGATISGRSVMYLYRNDLHFNRLNKLVRAKKFSSEMLYEPKIVGG